MTNAINIKELADITKKKLITADIFVLLSPKEMSKDELLKLYFCDNRQNKYLNFYKP